MLKKVESNDSCPGYWWFVPKDKPGTKFRMINLGGGISLSENKIVKLVESYKSLPDILSVLNDAYQRNFEGE